MDHRVCNGLSFLGGLERMVNGGTSLEVRRIERRNDVRDSRFVYRLVVDCTLESAFPIYILQSQVGRI